MLLLLWAEGSIRKSRRCEDTCDPMDEHRLAFVQIGCQNVALFVARPVRGLLRWLQEEAPLQLCGLDLVLAVPCLDLQLLNSHEVPHVVLPVQNVEVEEVKPQRCRELLDPVITHLV